MIDVNDDCVEKTVEKLYPIRSRRKTVDGVEYIYKNYLVYLRYDYMKIFGMDKYIYLYLEDGKVYVTSVQPDGSVPMKRLSLHKQNGRSSRANKELNEYWKRMFILPKKFFPEASEDKKVLFKYYDDGFERFSGVHASLTIELVDE